MTAGQVFIELLPIEINAPQLKSFYASRLKKGVPFSQIIQDIEKKSIKKIKKSVSDLEIESEFITAKKAINEAFLVLEYLVEVRNKTLSENENQVVLQAQSRWNILLQEWDPTLQVILKKRREENKNFPLIFKKTIDHMEEETSKRTKKIILKYEKLEKEKYQQIQKIFDQFFKNLRAHSEQIIQFIQPKLEEWNAQVLNTGRGFYIGQSSELPCAILFSVRGQSHLIFENVGHLLGSGIDKLVLRSISIPQGKVQALIKPIFIKETEDQTDPKLQKFKKEKQFQDMWLETEMLIKLKGKRGIIDLDERMVFQMNEEKTLFLIEDYYWDGTAWDYLKFPIHNKVESSKLSPKIQKRVLMDLLYGLVEIHKNDIVHHDIKPDNILMDFKKKGSKAVIADFHQATYLNDRERIKYLRVIPKWAAPEYAKIHLNPHQPPEILLNEYIVTTSGKLDVWSLGLVFYCLIAYELPFWLEKWVQKKEAESAEDLQATYQLLSSLKKGWLPTQLKTSPYFPLLEKMLDPDPQERCTALEALQILKNI